MAKIKFLQVFPFYPNYLQYFYSLHPELEKVDYHKNFSNLMLDCFGTADFWIDNLNSIGNYDARAIVFNDKILQEKWAFENHLKISGENWQLQILEAQLNDFKPDVVFWNDCMFPNKNYFNDFKKRFPFVKLLIGWDGVALNNISIFKNFDMVLTCANFIAEFYNANNIKSYLAPFGFEAKILQRIEQANLKKETHEITFCGSLNKGPHLGRYQTLLALVKSKLPIEIYTDAKFNESLSMTEKANSFFYGKYREMKDEQLIMKSIYPSVYGLSMLNLVKNSKISINVHIDISRNEAGNMRLFESTGVGSCMVTDWKDSLSSFFNIDEEVVVFKSIGEAKDKIENLLRDDALRTKIAKAGQARTLRDYSFKNKVVWLDNMIRKLI